MFLRFETLPEKKLIGKSMRMSLSENKTAELWRSFMSRVKDIKNTISPDLYSIQVYDRAPNFKDFNPGTQFKKCATIEVFDFSHIPENMETFILPAGLYAVFLHKGAAKAFQKTFQFIFSEWFPNSKYHIDQRPHFELLDAKYKNNSPDSQEEVWIPIRPHS
jgi:AraC family transcriptional regulator